MAANSIIPPYPIFFEADGTPLENGFIYIGEPGFDAQSLPKASFYDIGMTIPTVTGGGGAIRTSGGYPVLAGGATVAYVDGDFSITVRDRNGVLVYSALNRTFAYSIADASGSAILAPNGNFAGVGIGFIDEPTTGLVRQGPGVVQAVSLGNVIYQWSETGVQFLLPPTGVGFVSGVASVLDQDLKDIAALVPAEGDLIFRDATGWTRRPKGAAGQILRQNDALTIPVWSPAIATTAAQATTAGTVFNFTAIPAWVRRITVSITDVALSGSNNAMIQLGTASGIVSTGYVGGVGSVGSEVASTAALFIGWGVAGEANTATMTLTQVGATNRWQATVLGIRTLAGVFNGLVQAHGNVTLAAPLTQLRLTRSGADTFGAGSVIISYE